MLTPKKQTVDHMGYYNPSEYRISDIDYYSQYVVVDIDNNKMLLGKNHRPPYVGWFYLDTIRRIIDKEQ